jgi:hypothetical protein
MNPSAQSLAMSRVIVRAGTARAVATSLLVSLP